MLEAWFSISMSKDNKGFSLIEILLATALLSLFLTAVAASFFYGLRGVAWSGDRTRAIFLAEEGLAAAQNIRDVGFVGLTDGTFGLSSSGTQWAFSGSSDVTNIFTRQLTIFSIDTNTKSITSTVTWPKSTTSTGSVSLATRLTNWIANTAGNWSDSAQSGTYDVAGLQDGAKVAISGDYAYLIRSSGSPDFLVFNITDPLVPSLVFSTNTGLSLTNIAVAGNYAYLTSKNNSSELIVIDITVPSMSTIVGTYNAVGSADSKGVAVSGDVAYIVRTSTADPEFIAVNVAVKTAPALLGSWDLGDDANEIALSGSYAFVASSSNTQELQVVNISVPTAPVLAGSYDIGASVNALTVAVSGTNLFLGHGSNLRVFNITTPTSPVLIKTLSLGGTVNDLVTDGAGNLFAATSNPTAEFQVIDVTVPASSVILDSVDLTGTSGIGIAYDSTLDQCAVADGDNATEFIMVTHP